MCFSFHHGQSEEEKSERRFHFWFERICVAHYAKGIQEGIGSYLSEREDYDTTSQRTAQ